MTTLTTELTRWAAGLALQDIPQRVTDLAKSQVLSQLAAIRAGWSHPIGAKLIRSFGPPLQADAGRSACVLAALGSWLNLDDTAFAGHLSNSTVAVPVAYAVDRELDGARLLAAVVAANECAARVTAAATLGPFRGQTAAHTSVVGAVTGRLHCTGAPSGQWVDALGIAMTTPPWMLRHGMLAGEARALSVYAPVRMAMDACDASAAGLTGADDILEHPDGFLRHFATIALPEVVTEGLGSRWHTDTLSLKLRPGGPGVDSAVDSALMVHRELPGLVAADVREVVVETSCYTMHLAGLVDALGPHEHLAGSVLPLSVPYAVATALLTGGLTVADFAAPATRERRRWELAAKVRLVHDEDMTDALLAADAPVGAAIRLAGDRARDWVRQFAGDGAAERLSIDTPSADFENSTKNTGARVTVLLADGCSATAERDIPEGAAGPETRTRHAELARAKFLAAGGDEQVAARCAELESAGPAELAHLLRTALEMAT
jgi:2-methylcitrate dehydratase PrpD